jgi:hypothetical protein
MGQPGEYAALWRAQTDTTPAETTLTMTRRRWHGAAEKYRASNNASVYDLSLEDS